VDRFRIEGPVRLAGEIAVSGAKNAALPAMAASLLADGPTRLSGLPRVRDVETMRRLLAHLGVDGAWREASAPAPPSGRRAADLELCPGGVSSPDDAPYELVKTMRASVLVLGPLTARRGHARVSLPGGCAIGVRPIDQHLAGLEALGATVTLEHGYVDVRADKLRGARFHFAVPTVTGTENLMMAATLAEGTTVLDNCAREPEIADLARLLAAMGAEIRGAGSESIRIEGAATLAGARHRVIPDRIEAGTFLLGALLTGGDVTLANIAPRDLAPLPELLASCGAEVELGEHRVRVRRSGELVARDVVTAPFPGFPTDLQAQFMAAMTAARGVSTIIETVFENRMQHVAELARMGADIRLDGRTARVHGPTPLSGANVMATDLRASACLVLAALAADGESTIDRIYHLDRGYETIAEKLRALGARVDRVAGGDQAKETR
jgi:UDP-N-acetylglucosamine 1-carboxyvinyltransferase